MVQKEKSDIIGELSNMLSSHTHLEEVILNLNTMASENIKSIEETRKKKYKAMTENDDLESKINVFVGLMKKIWTSLKIFQVK